MRLLGGLLVTVSAVSILGGIGASLTDSRTAGRIRTITGLFILLAVLRTLGAVSPLDYPGDLERFASEAEQYAQQGKALSESERAAIISRSLGTYIETGAADYGLRLEAKVDLSELDGCTPVSVTLTGAWTSEQRERITADIAREIGIPKERQQWILRN